MAVGHYVCFLICEMECEMSNSIVFASTILYRRVRIGGNLLRQIATAGGCFSATLLGRFTEPSLHLLLLSLSSCATFCHFFFLKSGTLIFVLFGIIIKDACFHSASTLPPLWVRSAFALGSLWLHS